MLRLWKVKPEAIVESGLVEIWGSGLEMVVAAEVAGSIKILWLWLLIYCLAIPICFIVFQVVPEYYRERASPAITLLSSLYGCCWADGPGLVVDVTRDAGPESADDP